MGVASREIEWLIEYHGLIKTTNEHNEYLYFIDVTSIGSFQLLADLSGAGLVA